MDLTHRMMGIEKFPDNRSAIYTTKVVKQLHGCQTIRPRPKMSAVTFPLRQSPHPRDQNPDRTDAEAKARNIESFHTANLCTMGKANGQPAVRFTGKRKR